jgi:CheY-like chemotaxis protein
VVRAIMSRTLVEGGFRVVEARDGVEALEILSAEPEVGLVVSDIIMPRMDGYGLADRLPPDLPILFVSAYVQLYTDEVRWPTLRKPFPPATLVSTVRALLPRHASVRSLEVLQVGLGCQNHEAATPVSRPDTSEAGESAAILSADPDTSSGETSVPSHHPSQPVVAVEPSRSGGP